MNAIVKTTLNHADFEQALRNKGRLYHIHHPYHQAMYSGHYGQLPRCQRSQTMAAAYS